MSPASSDDAAGLATGFRLAISRGPLLRGLLVTSAVGSIAVLAGGAVAYGFTTPVIAAAVVGAILGVGWRHLAYMLPAFLLLLVMNAVPGLDMEKYVVPGSFRPVDVFAIGLIVLAAGRMLFGPRRRLPRLQQYLWIWAAVFLLVWLVALIRGMDAGTPWLKAALFGREFLYFAVLAPLAGYLFTDREVGRRFCLIIGVWVGLVSALMVPAQLGLIDPSLLNPQHTNEVGPIVRLYTPMADLIVLTFALSLAYALLGVGPGRRWGALLAGLTGLVCALSLTRALYVGLLIGIAVAMAAWLLRGGPQGRRLRRRMILTATAFGLAGLMSLVAFPQLTSSEVVSTVGTRFESSVATLTAERSQTTDTFAYREKLSDKMLNYLGDRWPSGIGFVPPSVRYVPGLPLGSLRNFDVGLLNGVMIIGVVGTTLLYVPLLLLLALLIGGRAKAPASGDFARFGLVFWGVTVIISSLTLVALYSITGLVMTALVLGYATRAMADRDTVV